MLAIKSLSVFNTFTARLPINVMFPNYLLRELCFESLWVIAGKGYLLCQNPQHRPQLVLQW